MENKEKEASSKPVQGKQKKGEGQKRYRQLNKEIKQELVGAKQWEPRNFCRTKAEEEEVIKNIEGLVVRIAEGYAIPNPTIEWEEIVAEAWHGVAKAMRAFDPTVGVKFSTYCVYAIKSTLNEFILKEKKRVKQSIPMSLSLPDEDDNYYVEKMQFSQIVGLGAENEILDEVVKKDYAIKIQKIVKNHLTDQEQFIFENRFEFINEGGSSKPRLTQMECAKMLNITQAAISKKEREIKQKIKIFLLSSGYTDFEF